jgi:hypothetical protein
MKQHPTDLVALLFGLAFALAGGIVLVTQATNFDVSPQWGAAVSLIVLGVVALAATVARMGTDTYARVPVEEPAAAASPEDRDD